MKYWVLLAALISGCVSEKMVWYNPSADRSQFSKDRYECLQQAQQPMSGAKVNSYGGASFSSVETNGTLFGACMNAKGWYLRKEREISQSLPPPLEIERPKPVAKTTPAQAVQTIRELVAQHKERCQEPTYQEILIKTPCLISGASKEQMADTEFIADEKKQIFQVFRGKSHGLALQAILAYREVQDVEGNRRAAIVERVDGEIMLRAKELLARKITWGQYNSAINMLADPHYPL